MLLLKDALRRKVKINKDPFTTRTLNAAEEEIFKYLQKIHFSKDIECIENNQNLPRNSKLRKLAPFIDDNHLVRVGGRLTCSNLPYEAKHPILIPESYVSELVVNHVHRSLGHLGREYMMPYLRKKFWLIGSNKICKRICNKCVICRKVQGKPSSQKMSPLPATRVDGDAPVFAHTGLDCFGPFTVSFGRKTHKRYGVVFTCLSSRAVHIEVANSLSTDSFINSLRRFICRRGNVRTIICDNGTNFVGAKTELKEAMGTWNELQIKNELLQRNIDWKLNTPAASHHGGVYEREIRSIRKVLSSILASQPVKLNDDELCTLLCEVESILNNRPLCERTSSPTSITALTPNNLLLLDNAVTFPPGLFSKEEIYAKRKWRQVQYLANLFWKRWTKEYLSLLQERQKWTSKRPNFEVNNLVLVMDVNLPRNEWPLGRIVSVKLGRDNLVRSCSVKIAKLSNKNKLDSTIIDRPVVKLIKLF